MNLVSPRARKYLALTAFGFLSFGLVAVALPEFLAWTQIPIIGGLAGALVQFVRDDAAHERALQAAHSQEKYSYGVESHMARVVFDKHVQFCEAYSDELNNAVKTLSEDGPAKSARDCANRLFALRLTYSVWLNDDIEAKLAPFEDALKKIGTSAFLVELPAGQTQKESQARNVHINRMYLLFAQAMGDAEWEGQPLNANAGHAAVRDALRQVIGSKLLSRLRSAVESAHDVKQCTPEAAEK